jgi:FimV-like protein
MMREQLLRSMKLDPKYAPAPHLLAFIDLVRNERLDEAVEMAQRARQLEPSKTGYALLLAQIYLQRSEREAARLILEPLTHDSDQAVKAEAQELLQSLTENRTGGTRTRSSAVNTSITDEPVSTGKSRMISGGSGGVAINDGQTIQTSGSLPTLDEVLAKHLEAMGGAAAIDKATSRVVKGELNVVGVSRGGSFDMQGEAPNKFASTLQAYPLGTVTAGYNGRTGWERTASGLRILKNPELGTFQREAVFYGQFRPKLLYPKMNLAGMSKIGFREVYVLDLKTGQPERLYLDAKTYLPVRSDVVLPVGNQLVVAEIYMDDWREVDGIKYPFYMSQKIPGMTLTFTVKEIKHNVPIDPKVFEP